MRSFLYLLGGFVLFSIAATFFLLPEHNKNSEKNTDEGVKFSFDITPTSATPNDTFWFVLSIVNHSNDTAKFWLGKDNSAKLQPLGKYIVEACFLGNKKCFKDSLWLVD